MRQDAVEDHGPDVTENDTADEVRHEEYRTVQVGSLDILCQCIGNGECRNIDKDQRGNRKQRGIPE